MKKTNLEWYKGETDEEAAIRHAQWERMSRETKIALRNSFPDFDKLTGELVWHVFKNADVYLPPQWTTDPNFDVGRSFRSWGALFGEMVDGTDYLDYYCNMTNILLPEEYEKVYKKLIADGWVIVKDPRD